MSDTPLTEQKARWAETMMNFERSQELGLFLHSERARLIERIAPRFDGLEWCRWFSALIDCALERLFEMAIEQAHQEHPEARSIEPEIAIVATGGYGREELSPYSDIDLTFIPYRDGDPFIDSVVRHMFRGVMDAIMTRAGIQVGYAYRLLEDCAQLDSKTRSGLVDMRFIAGSRHQFTRFQQCFSAVLNVTDFVFDKTREHQARLQKFGETPHKAEPHLKEGAGGLRDYHVARWLAQVRGNSLVYQVWQVLINERAISSEELKRLNQAFEFLTRVRNYLHKQTGEPRDVLARSRQEEIAQSMGFESADSVSPAEPFMREFYQHSAVLHRLSRRVIEFVGDSRLFLSIGLDCVKGKITPANEFLERDNALWALWAFRFAQQYDLKLSQAAKHQIEGVVKTPLPGAQQPEAASLFLDILSHPGNVARWVREMADTGLLGWLMPPFKAIETLIPYDSSHEYTVGEHTLRTLEFLDQLMDGDPLNDFRQTLEILPQPQTLYLALLMHDAGKIDFQKHHSETGEEMARELSARWGLEEKQADDLAWLVRHHLLMAETARQRDLTLDQTIRDFIAVVDEPERLQMLFLLTYADTNAVGAGVWTPVQAHFTKELYRRAMRALEQEEDLTPDVSSLRHRLIKQLSPQSADEARGVAHIQNMPPNYLLNTPLDQMALHLAYVENARRGLPIIEFYQPINSAHTELTIVTLDDPQPGLLSKIAGVLYACDLDVYSASVFTREDEPPVALDTLLVDYRGRQLSSAKCKEVKRFLEEALTGKTPIETLLLKKSKDPNRVQKIFKIRALPPTNDGYIVLDVQTKLGKGALFRLSRALSQLGLAIHSSRLGVWEGRAMLSFYVTQPQGEIDVDSLVERVKAQLPITDAPSSPLKGS